MQGQSVSGLPPEFRAYRLTRLGVPPHVADDRPAHELDWLLAIDNEVRPFEQGGSGG